MFIGSIERHSAHPLLSSSRKQILLKSYISHWPNKQELPIKLQYKIFNLAILKRERMTADELHHNRKIKEVVRGKRIKKQKFGGMRMTSSNRIFIRLDNKSYTEVNILMV